MLRDLRDFVVLFFFCSQEKSASVFYVGLFAVLWYGAGVAFLFRCLFIGILLFWGVGGEEKSLSRTFP